MSNTHYFPVTEKQQAEMLSTIGVHSFEELIAAIPTTLRHPVLDLPEALSEIEILRHIKQLARQDAGAGAVSLFAGAGAYEHFIPAAVDALSGRGEFVTAYTPYQAEASQGTLVALFEYQTMIARLTGLQVSNASLYDGATAVAEACLVALQATRRKKVIIADTVHPEYREVAQTYLAGTDARTVSLPFGEDGGLDRKALSSLLDDETACVVIQNPNFFGRIEDLTGIAELVHQAKALLILTGHPIALAYVRAPGEWGADIACGELQPLGIPLGYGGPYAGYFVTTEVLVRRIPGRICGETVDAEGKRAFTLTLQAREQHIRRERATSNICTNQALMALRATIFMTLMGRRGFKQLALLNIENTAYLKEKLAALPQVSLVFPGPVFNEFVVRFKKPVAEVLKTLRANNIIGGVDLGHWFPKLRDHLLVCATETKSKSDLDRYVDVIRGSV